MCIIRVSIYIYITYNHNQSLHVNMYTYIYIYIVYAYYIFKICTYCISQHPVGIPGVARTGFTTFFRKKHHGSPAKLAMLDTTNAYGSESVVSGDIHLEVGN